MGDGYNFDTARREDQLKQMQALAARKVCAFCYDNIATEQREPIEIETDHWVVKKNDYPYENTEYHYLLIAKEHVKTFSELSADAQTDFAKAITETETRYKLNNYALGMRSGDFRFNGGSVEHLHAHIIVGSVGDKDHQPVRFKMSSQPKES